ncbi:MAG: hypothetical protein A2148_06750 [Chloroflexi bacterium RBG_16_68_14]|nr:MAG: hypothetical protein A2148_06750 [Chloroflexi bacterium RBG_16_68_14]
MRALKAALFLLLLGWGLVSALAALFVRIWLRERRGRTVYPASAAAGLLNPLRGRLQPVRPTLERFRLGQGDTALEVGPGPGYFSIEASSMVGPTGRVLCLDLQPGMAAILRERLREARAGAAQPVVGDATHLPLADGSVDRAFLVAVLGEVPDRPAAVAELRRVMKPGSILGFSETLTDPDYMFQDALQDLCAAFGFELLERRNGLLGYTMTFRAPGPP